MHGTLWKAVRFMGSLAIIVGCVLIIGFVLYAVAVAIVTLV